MHGEHEEQRPVIIVWISLGYIYLESLCSIASVYSYWWKSLIWHPVHLKVKEESS